MSLMMTFLLLSAQDVQWKTNWKETLAEAKKNNKLAVLVFFNIGVKDCKRFDADTLPNDDVKAALNRHICAKIDPEGTDDDNKLWQEHKMPTPPMTYVYDPEGRMLTNITALNPKRYAEALDAAGPAYFKKIQPALAALAGNAEAADQHALLGEAYADLDNRVESPKAYDRAVELFEKKGDTSSALRVLSGQLTRYYERKWYGAARKCCLAIGRLDPSNGQKLGAMAAWVFGMADCEDRKWNDAISGLSAACDKFKGCDIEDKIMFSLGAAYMYAGQKEQAIKTFDSIVAKFPDSESAKLAEIQATKLRK